MGKYYFYNKNDEMCCNRVGIEFKMAEEFIPEKQVWPAIIEKIPGMFWCGWYEGPCEVGEGCGKFCPSYKPRNGKSGICIHHGFFYVPAPEPVIIKSGLTRNIKRKNNGRKI